MKYKIIKSAAHNFGHSFVSPMNWSGDDYTMSHLAREVVERGMPVLEIDLLSGSSTPQPLLVPPVSAAVAGYLQWFPELLVSNASTRRWYEPRPSGSYSSRSVEA